MQRTEIVRHDHNTSLVFFDRTSQSINGSHVQVVSGLIEQEDVWMFHGELSKDSTTIKPG